MNDSADIKTAAGRLQSALGALEDSLAPLMSKITALEKTAKEAETFQEDRAQLATLLDESVAKEASFAERDAEFKQREATYAQREAKFNALAQQSETELDAIILQVQRALSGEAS